MLSKRRPLCAWLAYAGEDYMLKWDIIERHLEPDQYAWFFRQPLYKVQLVLDNYHEPTGDRWVTLVAEFFDLALEEEYTKLWG